MPENKKTKEMEKLVTFLEIPVTDMSRAMTFYNKVFGWEMEVCECGEEQMAFIPGEDNNVAGALSKADGFVPGSAGVLVHFNAKGCIDGMLEKVPLAGGKIITPKTAIIPEEMGVFAVILDSEGNRIGLHDEHR